MSRVGRGWRTWAPWRRGTLHTPEALREVTKKVSEALDRIGPDPEDWAKWFDAFAYRDLDGLSQREWKALRWEVTALEHGESGALFCLSEQTVRGRQQQVQRGFRELAKARKWTISPAPSMVWSFSFTNRKMHVESRFSYLFKMALVEALSVAGHRFRTCVACRRPFLKFGKRVYCTPQCTASRRAREYRARLREARQA